MISKPRSSVPARGVLGRLGLSISTRSMLGSGPALGVGFNLDFVESELAVFARAVGSEVGLMAVLVGLSGSSPGTGVEPRESVCGHCAVCGHRNPEATSTAECCGYLRGNL